MPLASAQTKLCKGFIETTISSLVAFVEEALKNKTAATAPTAQNTSFFLMNTLQMLTLEDTSTVTIKSCRIFFQYLLFFFVMISVFLLAICFFLDTV